MYSPPKDIVITSNVGTVRIHYEPLRIETPTLQQQLQNEYLRIKLTVLRRWLETKFDGNKEKAETAANGFLREARNFAERESRGNLANELLIVRRLEEATERSTTKLSKVYNTLYSVNNR